MGWLSNLFRASPEAMPENPPALPVECTRSAKQYPARLLDYRDIRARLGKAKSIQINWAEDRSTFSISGEREDFRRAAYTLITELSSMIVEESAQKRRRKWL